MIQQSNGTKSFDWTFGCEGCRSRKEYLLEHRNDFLLAGAMILLVTLIVLSQKELAES